MLECRAVEDMSSFLFLFSSFFPVTCKIVYRWVTRNCCFMSDNVSYAVVYGTGDSYFTALLTFY